MIHTGRGARLAIAARYAPGSSHANASITTSAICSASPTSACQCSIAMPSSVCRLACGSICGSSRAKVRRSSTKMRICQPCSCASWRARRQHTPMSPKLSITVQKRSHAIGSPVERGEAMAGTESEPEAGVVRDIEAGR
ncbi:hypothetical protein BVI1335_1220030 [Burkholderia vietnamiensis]|nr:hypothetical protein BVI1335_1220030 [Burkholderia vietnamiensis]